MTVDYEDAMQILEDPKAAAWELRDLAKSLLEDLLATQAREKVLRDALRTLSNHYPDSETLTECDRVRDVVDTALSMPTDDTALKQLLASEREQCEKVLKDEYLLICSGAKQARALGDKP